MSDQHGEHAGTPEHYRSTAHQQLGGVVEVGQAPFGQDGPGMEPGAGNGGRKAAKLQAVG